MYLLIVLGVLAPQKLPHLRPNRVLLGPIRFSPAFDYLGVHFEYELPLDIRKEFNDISVHFIVATTS